MIKMEDRHLSIVMAILSKYPYTFYAFGSRVNGEPRKFSDLDLAVQEDVPLAIISQIKEDFDGSKLPFKVDVVNLETCDEHFLSLIKDDLVRVVIN